jgi:prevent-host-death family protein
MSQEPPKPGGILRGMRCHPESDNLIAMKDVTATDAARHFSDLLDAVEHAGESFTVTRSGRVVARIVPAEGAAGRAAKDLLLRHRPDARWRDDLAAVRAHLFPEDRNWTG